MTSDERWTDTETVTGVNSLAEGFLSISLSKPHGSLTSFNLLLKDFHHLHNPLFPMAEGCFQQQQITDELLSTEDNLNATHGFTQSLSRGRILHPSLTYLII